MPYDSWRTVDAPLNESRIAAMKAGEPVHLIIWPTSRPGTRYYFDADGNNWMTVTVSLPTPDGRQRWTFMDNEGRLWDALTIADGQAHAATLINQEVS